MTTRTRVLCKFSWISSQKLFFKYCKKSRDTVLFRTGSLLNKVKNEQEDLWPLVWEQPRICSNKYEMWKYKKRDDLRMATEERMREARLLSSSSPSPWVRRWKKLSALSATTKTSTVLIKGTVLQETVTHTHGQGHGPGEGEDRVTPSVWVKG